MNVIKFIVSVLYCTHPPTKHVRYDLNRLSGDKIIKTVMIQSLVLNEDQQVDPSGVSAPPPFVLSACFLSDD